MTDERELTKEQLRRFDSCRRLIFGVFCMPIILVFTGEAASQASKEQCTCDLVERKIQDHGAEVVNAGSCVRHDFENDEWCQIYIKYLEDQAENKDFVRSIVTDTLENSGRLSKHLLRLFDEYVKWTVLEVDFPSDRSHLKQVMADYNGKALDCVKNFAAGKPFSTEEGLFSCRVAAQTRWLRLSYKLDPGKLVRGYSFLFAPFYD